MMILILITYGYGLHQSKDTMFHFLANVPLLIKTTIFFITALAIIIEGKYGVLKKINPNPLAKSQYDCLDHTELHIPSWCIFS